MMDKLKKSLICLVASSVTLAGVIFSILGFLFGILRQVLEEAFKGYTDYEYNSSHNKMGYFMIAGIIVGVIALLELIKRHKEYKDSVGIIDFGMNCMKSEYGKENFQLALSVIFGLLGIIIIAGLIALLAGFELGGKAPAAAPPVKGRPAAFDDKELEQFHEICRANPDATATQLREIVKDKMGKDLNETTIRKYKPED